MCFRNIIYSYVLTYCLFVDNCVALLLQDYIIVFPFRPLSLMLNTVFYAKWIDHGKCTQLPSNMEKKIIIPSCLGIVPRIFSLLPRNSNINTTTPVQIKNTALPNHMPGASGFKKIHVFLFMLSLTGTIIAIPDSVYGRVKSTQKVRLYLIVISPIAISYICKGKKKKTVSLLIENSFCLESPFGKSARVRNIKN